MHERILGQGLGVSAIGLGAMGMSQGYGPNPGDRDAVLVEQVDIAMLEGLEDGDVRAVHLRGVE